MKLTKDQEKALARIREADYEYRTLREAAEQEIRDLVEKRVEAAKARRDVLVYQARQGKSPIPVLRIAREGLSTTATITAYQAIENGKLYAEPAATKSVEASGDSSTPADEFVRTGPTSFRVTPSVSEVATILGMIGMDEAAYEASEQLQSAEFELSDGALVNVTPAFDPQTGRHPVVALVQAPSSQYGQSVRKWAEENLAA